MADCLYSSNRADTDVEWIKPKQTNGEHDMQLFRLNDWNAFILFNSVFDTETDNKIETLICFYESATKPVLILS